MKKYSSFPVMPLNSTNYSCDCTKLKWPYIALGYFFQSKQHMNIQWHSCVCTHTYAHTCSDLCLCWLLVIHFTPYPVKQVCNSTCRTALQSHMNMFYVLLPYRIIIQNTNFTQYITISLLELCDLVTKKHHYLYFSWCQKKLETNKILQHVIQYEN